MCKVCLNKISKDNLHGQNTNYNDSPLVTPVERWNK